MTVSNITERLGPVAGSAPAAGTRGVQEGAAQAKPTPPASQSASTQESSATVQLSSAATALLEGAEGGFDAEKVERVRNAISNGTYKINPEAIADKLISNAQELLGKR